ncbi:tudor and KH domain containing protein papi [Dermatophagoides farinae]|uniref:tudor and KH domain containing protein papi n=1 Tax=Dermatophagoides farinae TaxID=6954 RepID=UPI003F62A83B
MTSEGSSSIKKKCIQYIHHMLFRMSCLSKSLFWFGGIGASLILAYGSIYLFANRDDDEDDFDDDDQFKFNKTGHVNDKDQSNKLFVHIDNGSDTMSDDSSIEIILLYKRVPNSVFEQNDCFIQIQYQTDTKIKEEKIIDNSFESDTEQESIGGTTVKYRNISIQGFHKNVMQASRRIDQLVRSVPPIECTKFEILSTKLPLIMGVNGSTIKSLTKCSGAEIRINQPAYNKQFITVDIYGTRDQIKMAYNLIEELLDQERRFHRQQSTSDQIQIINLDDDGDYDMLKSFETFELSSDLAIMGDNHPQYIQQQQLTTNDSSLETFIQHRTSLSMERISYMTESLDVIDDHDRSISPSILPPVQVFVSYIDNPSSFYVQINENRRSIRLDELMEKMKKFYSNIENQLACRCDRRTLKINDIVAIKVDDDNSAEKFYRGYIIDCLDGEKFSVFYGDFGITAQHSANSLFYLNDNFLTRLPFQAIRCSLNDIDHISPNEWSAEEIKYFRELTREGLWESVISIRCHEYRNDNNNDGRRIFLVEMFSKLPHQLMTKNVGKKLLQLLNRRKKSIQLNV